MPNEAPYQGRSIVKSGYPISGNAKPGGFQPVTGQAVITQTTCVDDAGAKIAEGSSDPERIMPKPGKNGMTKNIGQRVESHLLALRKIDNGGISKRRFRNQRGSGAALKIFTFLNNREKPKDFHNMYEHVGVVQTAINPGRAQ